MDRSAVLKTAWRHQAVWSTTAGRFKRTITLSRRWALILVIGAAVLATAGGQVASMGDAWAVVGKLLVGVSAAAATAAGFLGRHAARPELAQRWTRARSVSEAIKAEVYQYVTSAAQVGETDAAAVLQDGVEQILAEAQDLLSMASPAPTDLRDPPPLMNAEDYLGLRVTQQIDEYYRPQADEYVRRMTRLRRWEFFLLLFAAVLGALVTLVAPDVVSAWVAVITTVTGALGTHTRAARYEHLVLSYRSTAQRLESLRDRWLDDPGSQTPESFARLVAQCEEAISIENQAWMAKRD